MKYVKTLGITAAIVALSALASSGMAMATVLDGSSGQLPVGTKLKAEAEGATELHPPIGSIRCEESWWEEDLLSAGGSSETVKTLTTAVTYNRCNGVWVLIAQGTHEIHTPPFFPIAESGSVRSTGMEATIEYLGFHCIFKTNNTIIGTLTGSASTKGAATLDVEATIPRTGGKSGAFCGTTAQWTGSYKFTTPSTLNVT